MKKRKLKDVDKKIHNLLKEEERRREDGIELIPSENHTLPAVLSPLGSILSDKYAEGYPGGRYYGGNEVIDKIEKLCIDRAKELFNVAHVNVQPYSGSPANQAVYFALLSLGDKIMGMELQVGGHLTHGNRVNFSGKYYQSFGYGVNGKTGKIDYKEVEKLAREKRPKLIFVGTTAYPRKLNFKRFKEIADSVGAYLCADIAHIAGLVVAGVHPSPAAHADIITTTTHKTLRGPRGGMIMVTKKGLKKDKDLPSKIDRTVFPGLQGGPHENQIAGIAACLKEAGKASFKNYAEQVVKNSKFLAEELKRNGFSLVSGGTDNHLMVIDLKDKDISGKKVQERLDEAGITVNKNTIPFDTRPPFSASGIRLGTPAVTTRGMKEKEMKEIAGFITEVIKVNNPDTTQKVKKKVKKLCNKFPIPK